MVRSDHPNDHPEIHHRASPETTPKQPSMTLPATMLEPSDTPWWAERFFPVSGAPVKKIEALAAARQRVEALFHTDADERLAYLESPE